MFGEIANSEFAELQQFSNKISYPDTGGKNSYFMIEERA
jgi:hypothetical protein